MRHTFPFACSDGVTDCLTALAVAKSRAGAANVAADAGQCECAAAVMAGGVFVHSYMEFAILASARSRHVGRVCVCCRVLRLCSLYPSICAGTESAQREHNTTPSSVRLIKQYD